MASIVARQQQDGTVTWQVKIRRRGYAPVSRTFVRRADAERFARQTEADMDKGVFVSLDEAHSVTLSDLIDRFRREFAPRYKGRHVETILRMLEDRLGKLSPAALTATKIAAYRDGRLADGVSGETVRKELALLSKLIKTAMREWGIALPGNPVANVSKPPPSKPRERRLKEGEEARLMASLDRCRNRYMRPWPSLRLKPPCGKASFWRCNGIASISSAGSRSCRKRRTAKLARCRSPVAPLRSCKTCRAASMAGCFRSRKVSSFKPGAMPSSAPVSKTCISMTCVTKPCPDWPSAAIYRCWNLRRSAATRPCKCSSATRICRPRSWPRSSADGRMGRMSTIATKDDLDRLKSDLTKDLTIRFGVMQSQQSE